MHGIATTKFGPDRLDIFWTDPNFQVLQRTWDGSQWLGWYELGGQFATVPAAVASMAQRAMVVNPGDAGGGATSGGATGGGATGGGATGGGATGGGATGGGGHGVLGGHGVAGATAIDHPVAATDASTPAVGVSAHFGPAGGAGALIEQRIDVFGIGLDYAMYTKTLWGAGADAKGAWYNLGGIFTSSPAAIVWNGGHGDRIDVFGLGTDHALFQKTWNGSAWTANWTRLGGTFSSAPTLVSWGAGRLDVFARGADFTLRHRTFTGTAWTNDWQNLGGSLASEPVAVSWGPDRLDVFAIFHDGMLWHRWWDGMIWNDWESLGGRNLTGGTFSSAPSATSWAKDRMDVFVVGDDQLVYHLWWSEGAWSGPEVFAPVAMTSAPTVISIQANWLDVFAPGADQNLYHRQWNGGTWQPAGWEQLGGHIRLPSRYRFSVDYVTARTTRSLNADTDTASATLAAGNWPSGTKTQSMGDVGGTHPSQAQLQQVYFDPAAVELCEVAIFSYLVVNNGNAGNKELTDALKKAEGSLTDDAVKSVSKDLSAGAGAIVGVVVGGNIAAPIIGSLVGSLSGWLMGKLEDATFADCDGIVAGQLIPKLGMDLHKMTGNGPYRETTSHPGTDSPFSCGDNSLYEVTWSITRV